MFRVKLLKWLAAALSYVKSNCWNYEQDEFADRLNKWSRQISLPSKMVSEYDQEIPQS